MKHPKLVLWFIWSLGVLFLAYKYFIQSALAVMSPQLMDSLKIGATQFGTLSSAFFISYSIMQIPVGLLMDRFGARRLLSLAAVLLGVACIVFASTDSLSVAIFSRLLMGIGGAFGFVGMAYISSHWFSKDRLPLLVGVGNSLGMLGVVIAQAPLSVLLNYISWEASFFGFAAVGIFIGFGIMLLLRNERFKSGSHGSDIKTVHAVKGVLLNKWVWINALASLLFYVTTTGFGGLWGIPFIKHAYNVKTSVAAFAVSMVFFGWIVGGPLVGIVSDRLAQRKKLLVVCLILALASLLPVIYITNMNLYLVFILMFCIGLFSSAQLLSFSLAVDAAPIEYKATSIAMTNCFCAIGSFIVQPLVGYIIDLFWNGTYENGVPLYTPENYQAGLIVFPISMVLSLVFILLFKEKKHDKPPRLGDWDDNIGIN
jgi:sugar phosphate permease